MTTEELVAQNIAAIPVSEPSIRAKSAPRLYVVLLFGSLIGALLGAQNLETWVEDWPTWMPVNQGMKMTQPWLQLTEKSCLADLHPTLRHWQRSLEVLGSEDIAPPPPDLHCGLFKTLVGN